ncbi:acyl carrier protein [Ruminococcaceae bacterium FB2012]|nr:acyl carrier protein [Ruminococcaceae bacterium FB2012]
MANNELKEKIKQALLTKLELDDEMKAELDYDTQLFGDEGIGLDSMDSLELVTLIYDEWRIDVPSEDMKKLVSVNAIAEYIEGYNK